MALNFFFLTRKRVRPKLVAVKYLANKERARDLVLSRLSYFNEYYHLSWNRVSIKNTKRRWGSCSKKGNLNFCYKLVFLPPELADYIVVHELCNLVQFNHSKAFWAEVAKTVPDHVDRRAALLKRINLTFN
jgi:predicted metal-dependent hydrolase